MMQYSVSDTDYSEKGNRKEEGKRNVNMWNIRLHLYHCTYSYFN